MEDKTFVLITGATSDIGKQICSTLEESGYNLLMTDLNEEALLETKASMSFPEKHHVLKLDLSDVELSESLLSDFLVKEQIKVSKAVFAAGIFSIKPLKLLNYAYLKKNFDISLFSIFSLARVLCSKRYNADNLRCILMISSVSAIKGTKGFCVYGAVKSGMLGLMKSLAVELAPQVRVNAILPGGIRTRTTNFIYEMQEIPDPRYLLGDGNKSDISNMVDFLLSDRARWITGQEFIVDGGMSIS